MATLTRGDTLEEVFTRIDTLGYAMGSGGFTSHAPMATETLVALGYHQEAIDWLDRYMRSVPHAPRPERVGSIDPADESSWREALGDHDRLADWVALFDEELENAQWQDVLARWWPRLVPGFLAGLTHGLIRTAHASRVLAGEPNPSRTLRRELARGLGYLAARNSPLPGQPSLQGALSLSEAIAGLPEVHPREVLGAGVERRSGGRQVTDEGLEGFADAVNALAAPGDIDQALLDLTHETAGLL
ncbi:MAG TPA: questin oxidase family protein, partial [Chloroflexota bacterium]